MTDLMTAIVTGSTPPEIQDLLDTGEEINARVANGWTALLLAGMHSVDTDVLRVLIDAGADVHARTDEGMSVLHTAAMVNNAAAAALFVEAGADVEVRTNNGTTPVIAALGKDGGVEALQVLLDAGADPNTPDDSGGLTPLMYAVYANGNIEVLRVLIEAGADPNGALPDGTTAGDALQNNEALADDPLSQWPSEGPTVQNDHYQEVTVTKSR
ncbi:MAG: ankyrin repeat domain-containing protein [Spirochaeta sp.]|jgi:ankyrin repeat protein|nr:ankyrin repeat domain-containing protein [Spirochaeta sp.]